MKNDLDFYYSNQEISIGFKNIKDIDNQDIYKSVNDFFEGLTQSYDNRNGISKYYYSAKKINNKNVIIRVSDHSHSSDNEENNTYIISVIINGDYIDGVDYNDDYTEIRMTINNKNIENKLTELVENYINEIQYNVNTFMSGGQLKTDIWNMKLSDFLELNLF